ncbi:MAG: tellurite resistance/C4-dicarboxylate transporter family protein [Nitrososphaerota archaeon]
MKAIKDSWLTWIRSLYTGYFASVMATGIVSVALLFTHQVTLSALLWGTGFVFLAYFVVVYLIRIIRFGHEVKLDAMDPSRVFGYFTFIAALGVMATRSALSGWTLVPGGLTLVAAIAWCFLLYWAFAMLLFTNERPIERALNGSWLVAIVSTESLAITWVLLASAWSAQRETLQLLAYAFWTFGVLLYLIFITLIMYRFFFLRVQSGDLTPPYWINMGAMAITSVAGMRLLEIPHPGPFLVTLRPYIEGFTVMMWAWGTWWIPLLIIIGIWKYMVAREPVRYQPALWSMVFPLGMYATSLHLLGQVPGLAFLAGFGPSFTWIAFGAWVLVALGWVWSAVTSLTPTPQPQAALADTAADTAQLTAAALSAEAERQSGHVAPLEADIRQRSPTSRAEADPTGS